MMGHNEIASAEADRLRALLRECNVKENRIALLEPVIENTAWMKAQLDKARTLVRGSSIVISYDNGGGQSGLRENPAFKGYEALWKSYMAGMCKILEYVPRPVVEREAEQIETPKTVLDLVRARRKKEA